MRCLTYPPLCASMVLVLVSCSDLKGGALHSIRFSQRHRQPQRQTADDNQLAFNF
jgi:hypothetical protein